MLPVYGGDLLGREEGLLRGLPPELLRALFSLGSLLGSEPSPGSMVSFFNFQLNCSVKMISIDTELE